MRLKNVWVLALLFAFSSLTAGTTGKIVGRVTDKHTGEPLPAANIIIEGTRMGASSDQDGYYVILNVPPGTYTLTCSYIGYKTMKVENVTVDVDRTTEVNFKLEPATLVTKEVVAVAKEPIIKKDLTASVDIVKSSQLAELPVTNVAQVVSQQAGVIARGGLHVRGGRPDEVVYVIDGVEIRDPYSNNTFANIPLLSIEETSISKGGFDVDQGTVSSGTINIVTKEGGPRYGFTLETVTSDFSFLGDRIYGFLDRNWGDEYYDFLTGKNLDFNSPIGRHHSRDYITQFSFGGPINPRNRSGAKFFISGEYQTNKGRFPVSPDPKFWNVRKNFQWKITYPLASWKFFTSGFWAKAHTRGYSPYWRLALDHTSYNDDNQLQFIFGINKIFSSRTYWELRLGYFRRKLESNVMEDVDGDGVDDFADRDKDGFVEIDLDYFKKLVIDTFRTHGRIDSVHTHWEWINIDSLYSYVSPNGDTVHPEINWSAGYVEIPYYWWDTETQALYPSIGSGPKWWPEAEEMFIVDPIFRDTVDTIFSVLNTEGWGQRSNVDLKVLVVEAMDDSGNTYVDTVLQVSNDFYEFPFRWPLKGHEFTDSIVTVIDTLLKVGSQYLPGMNTWQRSQWYYGNSSYLTFTTKLTSQVTKHHEILAGMEYKRINITRYGADYASGGNVYLTLLNPHLSSRPGDPYTFINWFNDHPAIPWVFAAYLRDKIEMEGMIAKVGFRIDYYNSGGYAISDSNDPFVSDSLWHTIRMMKNPVKVGSKWYISPRLGVSHPISDRDVLHFTYGHYLQIPPFYQILSNYVFSGAFPIVGNANIEPEKTISYELGLKHAINNQMVVDVTAFYKDILKWSRLKQFSYGIAGANYSTYVNEDWGTVRGIEFSFSKRPGGMVLPFLTLSIDYTLQYAYGSFSSPFNAYDWMWRGYPLPHKESPLDWDQRHSLVANFGVVFPKNKSLANIRYLNNFSLMFQFTYGSGYPYTPPIRTPRDAVEKINSARLPSHMQLNMKFIKNFEIGKAKFRFYVDVLNVTNRKDLNRFENVDWYVQFHMPEGEVRNPAVYYPGRTTRLGLEFKLKGF